VGSAHTFVDKESRPTSVKRLASPAIHCDRTIDRHSHEVVGFNVLELHNLMALMRRLPPNAWCIAGALHLLTNKATEGNMDNSFRFSRSTLLLTDLSSFLLEVPRQWEQKIH
jgi:hypothetical protein